jgi:predicted Zn-dependent protease
MLAVLTVLILSALNVLAQTTAPVPSKAATDRFASAKKDFDAGNLPKTLKALKDVTEKEPQWIEPAFMEGDILFILHRLDEASAVYQTVRTLDDAQHKLTADQRHQLISQQGILLLLSKKYTEAVTFFEAALKTDSNYPLYYYNLASAYAYNNDLEHSLANLKKSWELRSFLPESKDFPDPRQDAAFQKFLKDPKFQAAVAPIPAS